MREVEGGELPKPQVPLLLQWREVASSQEAHDSLAGLETLTPVVTSEEAM